MSHSGWLSKVFKPVELSQAANDIANQIIHDNANGSTIRAIAVTGLSGLTFGSVISYLTGLPLIALRKTDYSHSSYTVEYDNEIYHTYCIVDDLIASGSTINRIINTLEKEDERFHLEKIYLYSNMVNKEQFMDESGRYYPIYCFLDE